MDELFSAKNNVFYYLFAKNRFFQNTKIQIINQYINGKNH